MVINHEITIFDISRFLIATLTFWVVKSRRGSLDPYTQQGGAASLHVTGFKGPTRGVKGCKKKDWRYASRGSNSPVYLFVWLVS